MPCKIQTPTVWSGGGLHFVCCQGFVGVVVGGDEVDKNIMHVIIDMSTPVSSSSEKQVPVPVGVFFFF